MKTLDIDLLRAFVAVAGLKSFTAAGELLGSSQSAMSVKLHKLEERLGRQLLLRNPKSVLLTTSGLTFLSHARAVLEAHDNAARVFEEAKCMPLLRLAVSDHAIGPALPRILARLQKLLPSHLPSVVVGPSNEMQAIFDNEECDFAIVRQDGNSAACRTLFDDPLVWVKAPTLAWQENEQVPLVALRGACRIKERGIEALDKMRIPWRLAFVAGSVSALQAAISAGLGIGLLGARHAPADATIVTGLSGLPDIGSSRVALYGRSEPNLERAVIAAIDF